MYEELSRRERQVVDAVFALDEATAHEVVDRIGEPEAYDSIRVIMGNLHDRGLLDREREGREFVYRPGIPEEKARWTEMRHLERTFFDGSSSRAILAFLEFGMMKDALTRDDLDRIAAWIEEHADEERG